MRTRVGVWTISYGAYAGGRPAAAVGSSGLPCLFDLPIDLCVFFIACLLALTSLRDLFALRFCMAMRAASLSLWAWIDTGTAKLSTPNSITAISFFIRISSGTLLRIVSFSGIRTYPPVWG